jgi:hypothetical protein
MSPGLDARPVMLLVVPALRRGERPARSGGVKEPFGVKLPTRGSTSVGDATLVLALRAPSVSRPVSVGVVRVGVAGRFASVAAVAEEGAAGGDDGGTSLSGPPPSELILARCPPCVGAACGRADGIVLICTPLFTCVFPALSALVVK